MAADDAADFELEAMSKDDRSWHPCQVHLSSNGAGLVIHYGNKDSEDILVSVKEALMRLRVRSLPLREDDCARIKEGEHVVVDRNSESESRFFDAEVERVVRVRHSKRMRCRCTFVIKWLNQGHNGESLVIPSSSIKRLAKERIDDHPTISAFIEAMPLDNSSFSTMSQQPDVVNDMDFDLEDLLEKQIEGIHNSINGSKMKGGDELLVSQVGTNEQVKEELSKKRSPLNPLAARAALASLISLNAKEGKSFTDMSEASPKSTQIVQTLFSDSTPSDMSEVLRVSSKRGKGRKKAEGTDFSTHITQPTEEKSGPEKKTRLTRVQMEGSESNGPTNRRLTRSVRGKEGEMQTIETPPSAVEKNKSSRNTKLSTSKHKVVDGGICTPKDKKTVTTTSLSSGEIDFPSTSLAEMEEGNKKTDISGKTCSEVMKKSSSARRLTRSLLNKETEELKMETKQESVAETDIMFMSSGIDSPPSEQRNKKKKKNTSAVATTTQNSEEIAGRNGRGGLKRKLRSSPRLTRS